MTNKIEIPEKDIDLENLGLINQGLFTVDGELALRYNGILKEVFGYECDVDSFRVDRRGLSPELSDYLKNKYPNKLEYGENYLNLDSANRFMIVVSPDQKNAPLVIPQTSYEDGLYDEVYRQARHTIEDITSNEALFGEIENGITLFRSAYDLLQLRGIKISLDTIGGTSNSISDLKELLKNLGKRDESLKPFGMDNALNHEYISRIQSLVSKVGNVEIRAISDIFPIKSEVHCFYVEFFKGVHCLRNFKNRDDIKAIFITHEQGKPKHLGDEILGLELHDKELLDVLHKYKFLKYDPELTNQRIDEIEKEVLLSKGIDVVSLPNYGNKREVLRFREELSKSWHELNDISRILENTSKNIGDVIEDMSYETKLKLSVPASKKEIINHMLAELDETDPVRVYDFNKRKFRFEFQKLPLNRQRYIVKRILDEKMKGGRKIK